MTRTARRSQRKYTLPATPWSILKRKFSSRYRTLEEENDPESESASEATSCTSADTMDESDSSMEREGTTTCSPPFIRAGRLRRRKAPERDFKETKKTKLNGSAAKRFFQKIKQKLTARKLRRRLKKTEVAPLLIEESGSGSDSGTATVDADRKEKKKSKRTKSAKNSKERKLDPFSVLDVKPLLDEGDESDDESSDASEGVGQGEEFEEIDLDGDISQVQTRRNKWPTKESMEIEEVVSDKKRRQIEARRLRRQKKKVCFNCRQSGHVVSECTKPQASGTGICFKCGAATHMSKNCKAKVAEGQYPYARCFICHEVGHLSSSCPDNPKGLYPHGGGCKVCGSVEHLKANCPERLQDRIKSEPWGSTSLVISNNSSIDAEEFFMDTSPSLPAVATPPAAASTSYSGRNQSTNGTGYRPRPKVVHF